jgi:hypothetical protein
MTKMTGNQGDDDRNEYASRPERNFSPRPARRGRIAEFRAYNVDRCIAGLASAVLVLFGGCYHFVPRSALYVHSLLHGSADAGSGRSSRPQSLLIVEWLTL